MAFQSVTGPQLKQAALQLVGVKSFTRIHKDIMDMWKNKNPPLDKDRILITTPMTFQVSVHPFQPIAFNNSPA